MEMSLLLFGKETIDGFPIENYQLLVDCNYVSAQYDESKNDREEFFDRTTSQFAHKYTEWANRQSEGLEISVGEFNGLKIDTTNKPFRIEKLEERFMRKFCRQFSEKVIILIKGRAAICRAADVN